MESIFLDLKAKRKISMWSEL